MTKTRTYPDKQRRIAWAFFALGLFAVGGGFAFWRITGQPPAALPLRPLAPIELDYGWLALASSCVGVVFAAHAARLRRRAAKAGFRWCPYCVHELIPDTRPAPTPHPSPPGPPNPAGDDAESAPPAERLWCTECGRSMALKESEYLWIPENRRHDERRRRAERDPAA